MGIHEISSRKNQHQRPRNRTPADDGGRQQSSNAQSAASIIAKPATAQPDASPVTLGGAYDEQFEALLTDVIGTAIRDASTLPSGALYIRSLETLRALSTATAAYLSLLPDADGDGAELGTTIDDLAERLFELATKTASNPEAQQFRKRLRYHRDEEAGR